jgi:hypothetical protein
MVDTLKIKTGIRALQTKGIYCIEFMVDGIAVKVMGHPYNEFIASTFWLEPHLPDSKQYNITYGCNEEGAITAQILIAINDSK